MELKTNLSHLHYGVLAGIVVATTLLAFVLRVIYNLYFHPLAKYPGPRLHRASHLGYVIGTLRGTMPRDVLEMHKKYGPIVRIAPNELAFGDPEAWKDIYGHKVGGNLGAEELPKYSGFYRTKSVAPSIISEDRENHALIRRQLAHGFSERSMREQEPIIGQYVDLLVERLHEHAVDWDSKDERTGLQAKKPMNMTSWYNWTTFDIIGDLAFGEPFGCLDKAKYDPWVAAIYGTIRGNGYLLAVKYLGLSNILLPIFRYFAKSRKEHTRRVEEKLRRRMEMTAERPDLIEGLLKKKDEWNFEFKRLAMNASTLIIAGSETTATLLCGVTYLLLRNPEALKKLTEEVRSTFKSEEEITLTSVGQLSYMLACLNEALRRYTPVPIGMPRVTPKGGATIAGEWIPENTVVAVWQWATNHNDENWTLPFEYHPERFMHDPKFARDKLDALQPFSVGPRNCIGRNLAYAEMRLILAKVIYNFDMQLVDPSKDWLDQKVYVLWSKPPLELYLTPVNR